jgi:hypothetical protein
MVSYERLVTLYEHVAYLERNHLPGALVECGVWKGGASGLMALANLREGDERRPLHLFDSFQGLPAANPSIDGAGSTDLTGQLTAEMTSVSTLIIDRIGYPASQVTIHPGWFADTLEAAQPQVGPIALLRLDGDWYESTMIALESFYDSVVPGGIVAIDDYGHWEGCRRAVDLFLATHEPTAYLHHVDYTGRYLIKPNRQLTHAPA